MSARRVVVVTHRRDDVDELGSLLDANPAIEGRVRAYAQPYLRGDGMSGAPGRERIAAFRAACERAAGHSPAEAWVNAVTVADVRALENAPDNPDPVTLFLDALDDVELIALLGTDDARRPADGPGGDDAEDGARDRQAADDLRREIAGRGGLVLDPAATGTEPADVVAEICKRVGIRIPEPPAATTGDAESS